MSKKQAIERARTIAGSTQKLADLIGCSQSMAWKMVSQGYATPKWVLPIERATGVSRHELAPDLYPPEDVVAKVAS